jgi:hypothetical protein
VTDVDCHRHLDIVSQIASSSGLWQHASFPLNGQHSGSPDAPLLEFVVTDNGTLWDKPADGAQRCCKCPQSFPESHRLQHG